MVQIRKSRNITLVLFTIPYHEGREPVFDPKPAYLAAKTLTTFFSGYRFEKRLNVGSADDYVLVFRKGGEHRVAAWTIAGSAHLVMIPLEAGQYSGVTHTGQNTAVVTADQKGLALTLTTAPVYLSRNDYGNAAASQILDSHILVLIQFRRKGARTLVLGTAMPPDVRWWLCPTAAAFFDSSNSPLGETKQNRMATLTGRGV